MVFVRWCIISRIVFCLFFIWDRWIGLWLVRLLCRILVVCWDILCRNFLCNGGLVFFRVISSDLEFIFCNRCWILWLFIFIRFLNRNILLMIFCVSLLLNLCIVVIIVFFCCVFIRLIIFVVVFMLFILLCFRFWLLSRLFSILVNFVSVVGCMLLNVVICSIILWCSCLLNSVRILVVWLCLRWIRMVVIICGCLLWIRLVVFCGFIKLSVLILLVVLCVFRIFFSRLEVCFLFSVLISMECRYLLVLIFSVVNCFVFCLNFDSMFVSCLLEIWCMLVIVVFNVCILWVERCLNIFVVWFLLMVINKMMFLLVLLRLFMIVIYLLVND